LKIFLGDAVGAARPRNYRLCSCESWEMKIASGKWRRDPWSFARNARYHHDHAGPYPQPL